MKKILLLLVMLLIALPALASNVPCTKSESWAIVQLTDIGKGQAPGVFVSGFLFGGLEVGGGVIQSQHLCDEPDTDECGDENESKYILAGAVTLERNGVFGRVISDFENRPIIAFGPGIRVPVPGTQSFGFEVSYLWRMLKAPGALEFSETGDSSVGINLWAVF